jgi:hypothetical protein
MRLIAAGLATLVLTGAASVAVATEAAADTPTFQCFNRDNTESVPVPSDAYPNKSVAQKAGFFRCFKQ